MSAITILRAADRCPQPWKNGGGETREVFVSPPGAGFEDFLWRVSIADVASDGPFSRFEGIDRVLTVLSGTLDLAFEGQPSQRLDVASAPFVFPGDIACTGTLPQGPVRDLNVMVRRGVAEARVRRVAAGQPVTAPSAGAGARLLVFLAPATLVVDGAAQALEPLDAVLADGAADLRLECSGAIIDIAIMI